MSPRFGRPPATDNDLYDPNLPFVETFESAKHFKLGPEVAAGGQLLDRRPPARGRHLEWHELETTLMIPAPEPADGLTADAAFGVVDDGQRVLAAYRAVGGGPPGRQRFDCHGAEW